ncbi:hypothetical protein [Spiroplasma sp. SV19]|uniref:hypothetical protein n=1 Tax=Spiroplasma sp. SV19 TaxID=2570468 RepID=UPI0024B6B198|nr:hypothetical protein [Spiroplasma sp. SV19]WHQ37060.1 hypothetical protein E7Y35_04080 [Spiroplasma sp. SV19]
MKYCKCNKNKSEFKSEKEHQQILEKIILTFNEYSKDLKKGSEFKDDFVKIINEDEIKIKKNWDCLKITIIMKDVLVCM